MASDNDILFWLKSSVLSLLRASQNLRNRLPNGVAANQLANAPIVARSSSRLWYQGAGQDWQLTAGKVENLRVAIRQLDGLEFAAGQVFSFWRHLGMPLRIKGYVKGRELREGCLLPTVAGGICQLSNGLYDAAEQAGFEIVERHRHSQVVEGSLAEQGRDATVKWNYIDLRFVATKAWRLEVSLESNSLEVVIRAAAEQRLNFSPTLQKAPAPQAANELNDCYACGKESCDKHRPVKDPVQSKPRTAYLLDDYWPEFQVWIDSNARSDDVFILPRLDRGRYRWRLPGLVKLVHWAAWYRAIKLRLPSRRKGFADSVAMERRLALGMARRIPLEVNHLVITQSLLPHLVALGVLGGRSYDVLMTRHTMGEIHRRLDQAAVLNKASVTLADFRAPAQWVQAEQKALSTANKLLAPHCEVAAAYPAKLHILPWLFTEQPTQRLGQKVLFPAKAFDRKGARLVKEIAQAQGLSLVVLDAKNNFWSPLPVSAFESWDDIGLLLLPAYVEHQPRLMLQALGRGIPCIASRACGVAHPQLTLIETGDDRGVRQAVRKWQSSEKPI